MISCTTGVILPTEWFSNWGQGPLRGPYSNVRGTVFFCVCKKKKSKPTIIKVIIFIIFISWYDWFELN